MLLKKIVIAEDDDAIAHMVSMALGDAGFLCLRARDGDEALKLVKAHDPDILVLDVMMPRVDGLEVARRLKADVMWSRTPILMLTALASTDDQVNGLEAGADAYMSKPFDLREMGARVKALIRAARRERDRNPTTNLPGSRAIDEEIEGALNRETCEDDTHPGPNDRFRLTRKIAGANELPATGMVWDLFTNREALTSEMTSLIQSEVMSG